MSEYLEIVAGTAYQHVIATPASGVFAVGEGASVRVCARYFPMCRPFEMAAVAAILARVDRGLERRDRRLAYTKADLLDPAPVTRPACEGVDDDRGSSKAGCREEADMVPVPNLAPSA